MKNKKRTIEEVAQLIVANGTSQNSVRFTPPQGFVLNAVLHFNDKNNTGFVQTMLKDAAGVEIYKPQVVESLRTRNVPFEKDGKPLNIETNNRTFELTVFSDVNFTADTNFQLILIYKNEC